jgi:PAT family beta-lactamase induction signal transducer AmpG
MSDQSPTAARSWRDALPAGIRPYSEKEALAALFLGISSGFPFAMIGATLTSRLAQDDIKKSAVTAFALTFLAYNLKWAWAPMIDKFRLPLIGRIGQRRSWMLVVGLLVMASVAFLGSLDPKASLPTVALASILVGIMGATFDIVIDAYRIELLEPRQLGVGSGMSQYGWRIGSAAAGAVALVVAARFGWGAGYAAAGLFALPAVVTAFAMGEPRRKLARSWPEHMRRLPYAIFILSFPAAYALGLWVDWLLEVQILGLMVLVGYVFPFFDLTARRARAVGVSGQINWLLVPPLAALVAVLLMGWPDLVARCGRLAEVGLPVLFALGGLIVGWLMLTPSRGAARKNEEEGDSVVGPLVEFFLRRGAFLILLFILIHKIGDTLANLSLRLLFNDLHFTNDEIAFYDVGIGLVALLLGVFVGGIIYARLGMKKSVLICLVLMAISNASFAALAAVGHTNIGMAAAMFFENFSSGAGGVALVAYFSALTDLRFTASQYALISAAASVVGRFLSGTTAGRIIEMIGYVNFYLMTTLVAFPGVILFWWMMRTGLVDQAIGTAGTVGEGDVRSERQSEP